MMRPAMVAGAISRNSRFLNLSVGLGWSAGPAWAFNPSTPRNTAQAKIVRRAFHTCFIFFSLCARPGMLLLLPGNVHQVFWKGKPTRCKERRAESPLSFTSIEFGRADARSPHATHRLRLPSNPHDRMLGYPIVLIDRMHCVNRHSNTWSLSALRPFLFLAVLVLAPVVPPARMAFAQQARFPSGKGGVANLEAKTQSRRGQVITADCDLDIHYGETRLRADHVEYNSKTYEATATGHVQLDYNNEHLEAAEAHYNVSTGHGLFHNVRGTVKIERRPNPAILISDNPLYFEARDVERFPGDAYLVHRAWITICDPEHPKWQFFAPNARIRLDKTVALINANFRLFRVPLISLPYASTPAGKKIRETGFLIPDIGHSSRKGFILCASFSLSPTSCMAA